MHHWTKGIMGDDPPYLAVGTEVSAKYKGAFCEAKVRKVVRSVKCKVTFKLGLGAAVVSDDQVRGMLRVGSTCEVKHPEKKEFVEATINKITDSSQYTVVFDDGDITTLRRTALCLKSGRHFAVSETLDQLPLTHPEHFSNPVVGGRKGRRSRQAHEDTSDEEDTTRRGSKKKEEKEEDIGRVVSVELGDKKKQKDNWFPGLVVAPTAQDTVRIRVRDEYLVRSFKDGRYFTVPKKEATEFTREVGSKVDNNTLKSAVEKALLFLDRDELPPHWDRDVLFGIDESSALSDSDAALDSDSSDDEPREEKDHFVAQLYKFMDDRGTPINNEPAIGNKDIDLYKLFKVVHKLGGYNRVTNHNQWKTIARKVGFDQSGPSIKNLVKQAYHKYLHGFVEFYRIHGCTMVNRPRHHGGRSLIRNRDRATPVNTPRDKDKAGPSSENFSGTPEPLDRQEEEEEEEVEKVKNKTDESLVIKEVVKLEEKSKSSMKEEKISRAIITPEKPVLKLELLSVEKVSAKKEKETKKEKDAKKEKETLKKAKESKKEKEVEEEKLKINESPKAVSGSSKVKEVIQVVELPPKRHAAADPDVTSKVVPVEKVATPPAKETKSVKEDKATKLRESKGKSFRQKIEERTKAVEEKEKEALKVREEQIEVVVSMKEEEKDESSKNSDDERSDDSKRRPDRKDDDEKQTRSKSKEDILHFRMDSDRRSRDSRDFDRPFNPRPRKLDDEDEPMKKRGRKRKETDSKASDEPMGQLGAGVGVGVGDKLKVYYGPTHESKVTYEAKVIEVEKETYLVHYTGWNTRYDEWIKRGRIAENLSWTPARAKRLKLQQAKLAAKMPNKPTSAKRGRPSMSGRDSATNQRRRSTTPSSVTSSSSRTKSPATPAPRPSRPTMAQDYRRRTRRMSGHTDISVASEVSASESEEYESEVEAEPTRTRSRSERIGQEKEEVVNKVEEKEEVEVKRSLRKKAVVRKEEPEVEVEVEDEVEVEVEVEEEEPEPGIGSDQVVEKRRSARMRKAPVNLTERKEEEVKREISTESEEEQLTPKGRDFDLNQIRSELKGIDRAVKLPLDIVPSAEDKEPFVILDDKTGLIDVTKIEEKDTVAKTSEAAGKNLQTSSNTDDIYEFKEPEPFEFEVRAKRETPVLPEVKPGRKSAGSKTAEVEEVEKSPAKLEKSPKTDKSTKVEKSPKVEKTTKVEKSPIARKKLVRNASAKAEAKNSPPVEGIGLVKKRGRRTFGKKSPEPPAETEKEVVKPKVEVTDPVTPQKVGPASACEEAFDKLCESPVFRPAIQRRTPSPGGEMEALSLFSELPDELKGEDDIDDRLLISEPEETEESEPLFTYSQSLQEELLPILSVVHSSIPPSLNVVEKPTALQQTPITITSAGILATFSKTVDSVKTVKSASPKRANAVSPSVMKSPPVVKCPSPVVKSSSPSPCVKSPVIQIASIPSVKTPSPIIISPIVNNLTEKSPTPSVPSSTVKGPTLTANPVIKSPSPIVNIPVSKTISPSVKMLIPSQSDVKSPVLNKKDMPSTKKEISITPKIKEEPTPTSGKSGVPQINEDMIARLLKESGDDDYEEDPIGAAIQRVVAQSLSHEESLEIAAKTVELPEKKVVGLVPVVKIEVPSVDIQKKESLKRKSGGRKPVLSQEFVDDSDSDSSDEEHRLVIDRIDDDDSLSLQGAESSSEQSSKQSMELVAVQESIDDKTTTYKMDRKQLIDEKSKLVPALVKDAKKTFEKKPRLEEAKNVIEPPTLLPIEPIKYSVSVTNENPIASLEILAMSKIDSVSKIQAPLIEKVEPSREVRADDDVESNLSLLCEETIPGSPQPIPETIPKEEAFQDEPSDSKGLFLEMPFASAPSSSTKAAGAVIVPVTMAQSLPARNADEAAPVIENTPPTTPDSSLSITSGSPREERAGLSPIADMAVFKSRSFESSLGKADRYSEEDDSLLNIEVSNSSADRPKHLDTPKKRQRARKRSECDGKRAKMVVKRDAGSDSDDTSENSTAGSVPMTCSENVMLLAASRSPRPSRYNFYVELDPELDGSQRIALLQQKLQELRKTYLTVKSELAGIDRRRKKLRRREREEKANKQEVACS